MTEEDVVAIGMNLWQFILFIAGIVLVVVIVAVGCWIRIGKRQEVKKSPME